jgi:hypothetical protein
VFAKSHAETNLCFLHQVQRFREDLVSNVVNLIFIFDQGSDKKMGSFVLGLCAGKGREVELKGKARYS